MLGRAAAARATLDLQSQHAIATGSKKKTTRSRFGLVGALAASSLPNSNVGVFDSGASANPVHDMKPLEEVQQCEVQTAQPSLSVGAQSNISAVSTYEVDGMVVQTLHEEVTADLLQQLVSDGNYPHRLGALRQRKGEFTALVITEGAPNDDVRSFADTQDGTVIQSTSKDPSILPLLQVNLKNRPGNTRYAGTQVLNEDMRAEDGKVALDDYLKDTSKHIVSLIADRHRNFNGFRATPQDGVLQFQNGPAVEPYRVNDVQVTPPKKGEVFTSAQQHEQ